LSPITVEESNRVAIGVTELTKSIVFYSNFLDELEKGNTLLFTYSLYYAYFHAAQYLLVTGYKTDINIDEWIAETPEDSKRNKWVTPWAHKEVIKKLRDFDVDSEFIDLIEDSKNIREFYSYGPKIIRNKEEKGYYINILEHKEIEEEIKVMKTSLDAFYSSICKIINDSLDYDHRAQFAIFLWTSMGLYLENVKLQKEIRTKCKEVVESIIDSIEKTNQLWIKRSEPLKSI